MLPTALKNTVAFLAGRRSRKPLQCNSSSRPEFFNANGHQTRGFFHAVELPLPGNTLTYQSDLIRYWWMMPVVPLRNRSAYAVRGGLKRCHS